MRVEIFNSFSADIRLADPQAFGNLTIFPLLGEDSGPPPYLLLEEALKEGWIEIKEIGRGIVTELLMTNRSTQDVFLIMGEELLGAKQNRTVNVSMVVPGGGSMKVPVSCTEIGRWSEREWGLKMAKTSAHCSFSSLRQALVDSITDSMDNDRGYHSDQLKIWDTISQSFSSMGIQSGTNAQSDLFETKKQHLEEYLSHFHLVPGQIGLMGLVKDEMKGFDIFGWEDTMAKMFPKLLKSFLLEGIADSEVSKAKRREDPRSFLDELRCARIGRKEAPGRGEHLFFEGKRQRGMALVVDGKLFHLYTAPLSNQF